MKKTLDILLILVAIVVVAFVGLTIFGVSVMGTKTDSDYFEKRYQGSTELTETRILYSFGLDTIQWEEYVLKRKVQLDLKKIERDSTISYHYVDPKDSLANYGSVQFVRRDKSLYILGEKHHILEPKKYHNKHLSQFPFDLYELVEPYDDANGPFLFNPDYGLLNLEVWSAGKQMFYLPTDSKINIEKELLRK
ncbi:hypothetical protein GCM10007103_35090 [Salinimicrobium marinum]|uniref:Uncharacterized protein n=1 Tax=Salinimicrobium marinum TaxID=680283 RepID=A0A918W2L7_9FLAO|nr:hypothetical protein GCM10007103_35090 [Salinimicrobium marinum]